jgi:hypothetical protein
MVKSCISNEHIQDLTEEFSDVECGMRVDDCDIDNGVLLETQDGVT